MIAGLFGCGLSPVAAAEWAPGQFPYARCTRNFMELEDVLLPGQAAWAEGRLLISDHQILLDPQPPGPPHPHFDGRPEPYSSASVRVTMATSPPTQPVYCEGIWTGDTLIVQRHQYRTAHQPPLRWGVPEITSGYPLTRADAQRILEHLPNQDEIVGVASRRLPPNGAYVHLVLRVTRISPQLKEASRSWPDDAVTVIPTLHTLHVACHERPGPN